MELHAYCQHRQLKQTPIQYDNPRPWERRRERSLGKYQLSHHKSFWTKNSFWPHEDIVGAIYRRIPFVKRYHKCNCTFFCRLESIPCGHRQNCLVHRCWGLFRGDRKRSKKCPLLCQRPLKTLLATHWPRDKKLPREKKIAIMWDSAFIEKVGWGGQNRYLHSVQINMIIQTGYILVSMIRENHRNFALESNVNVTNDSHITCITVLFFVKSQHDKKSLYFFPSNRKIFSSGLRRSKDSK